MDNKETYIKKSAEWKALNGIWKNCSSGQRELLYSDFETVKTLIIQTVGQKYDKKPNEYKYLNSISSEAKQFLISLVEKGEPNIYHSIASILNSKKKISKEELKKYYFKRYGEKRPYLIENKTLVYEIIDLCWNNIRK